MILDGLELLKQSKAINFSIANGVSLPSSGNTAGELFFLVGDVASGGLFVFDGSTWVKVNLPSTASEGQLLGYLNGKPIWVNLTKAMVGLNNITDNGIDFYDGAVKRSSLSLINGDTWILANAYYDPTTEEFFRVDRTKAAYGLSIQGNGYIPGEQALGFNVSGLTSWVASPASYDLIKGGGLVSNNRYATVGGWELGHVLTQERQFTIGGGGIEVDGYGVTPFGRFQHYIINGARRTGIMTNIYIDESGKDDNTKSSWWAGFNEAPGNETFKVQYGVPGLPCVWDDLLSISINGNVVFKPGTNLQNIATINGLPLGNLGGVGDATQESLDLKANLNSPTFTGTVGGITASTVGLGNVSNIADSNKPISIATQTALNQKANTNSPTFTGTVGGITASMVGLDSVNNTTDLDKPVSTLQRAALDLKANADGTNGYGTWNIKSAKLSFPDTRDVAPTPSQVPGYQVGFEFKSAASVGNPPIQAGNGFAWIQTIHGWSSDGSGGWPIQLSWNGQGYAIRQGISATAWAPWIDRTVSSEGSSTLATTAQAKAAISSTIAATPAGVREYLEQYGITATFTNPSADLNLNVNGGLFNWNSTTTNAPINGSYGRGITLPSGPGYITQFSIENATGKLHCRFQDNNIWGSWIYLNAPAASGGSSLPVGGTTGQLLAKTSNIDGAVGWVPAPIGGSGGALPAGGTAGQVLSKTTATDGDAAWTTPAAGGASAFARAVSTTNIVIQTLVPVTLVSLPLLANHAYRVRFSAILNDNSNTTGIKFSVGSIVKKDMVINFQATEYGATLPTIKTILEGDSTGANGVIFAGSAKNGTGNLITGEGNVIIKNNTTLTIAASNSDNQYDYRQFVAGCMLSVEDFGIVNTDA